MAVGVGTVDELLPVVHSGVLGQYVMQQKELALKQCLVPQVKSPCTTEDGWQSRTVPKIRAHLRAREIRPRRKPVQMAPEKKCTHTTSKLECQQRTRESSQGRITKTAGYKQNKGTSVAKA
mgnify:CR=1 FL=1